MYVHVICGFFLLHIYRDLGMSVVVWLWCILRPCLRLQNMCVVLIYSKCSHATLKYWLIIFLKVSSGSSKVKCVFAAIGNWINSEEENDLLICTESAFARMEQSDTCVILFLGFFLRASLLQPCSEMPWWRRHTV